MKTTRIFTRAYAASIAAQKSKCDDTVRSKQISTEQAQPEMSQAELISRKRKRQRLDIESLMQEAKCDSEQKLN